MFNTDPEILVSWEFLQYQTIHFLYPPVQGRAAWAPYPSANPSQDTPFIHKFRLMDNLVTPIHLSIFWGTRKPGGNHMKTWENMQNSTHVELGQRLKPWCQRSDAIVLTTVPIMLPTSSIYIFRIEAFRGIMFAPQPPRTIQHFSGLGHIV